MNATQTISAPEPARLASLPSVPLWKAVICSSAAGALGWGIRGQYGHETGAMLTGLLIGLILLLLFRPHADTLSAARAVAWCTIAIAIGGSMTYGQTVGLTHDAPLVGNWTALCWGMLGLAIKGAIWAGFAGIFLGIGLGGTRYRALEMAGVLLGLLLLCWIGLHLLNRPFDPANRLLPALYFSDSWRWEPNAELKPRREVWGGLLFALLGLIAYTRWMRRDPLGPRLALWGMLAGAIGFPLGQSLQAWHAWNLDFFRSAPWDKIDAVLNWWNFMETIFGAVIGGGLALGLWLNRARIAPLSETPGESLGAPIEWLLLAIHLPLLILVEFAAIPWVDALYDFGLLLAFIPLVAVTGGRFWPFLVILPITMLPIAGKTVRQLVYQENALPSVPGWLLYLVLPLLVATTTALILARASARERPARHFLAPTLLLCTSFYFALNFAFFRFPWPWDAWTQRTPNALVFTLCAFVLITVAVRNLAPKSPG